MSYYNRLNLKNGDVLTSYHLGLIENGIQENETKLNDFDATVKSINHRGYSVGAPENTLPAFTMSKKMGFNFVEADVTFTKDGVPDLLVCCNGFFLGIELKAENGKPSELQLWNLEQIRKAGGIGLLLYPHQFEEFKDLVENKLMRSNF